MSASVLLGARAGGRGLVWLAMAPCIAVLCLVFRQEIAAAVTVWNTSTAYGHCWLVLPIACWLLWERRDAFAAEPPRPMLWAAVLAVPLAAGWVLAFWLGIMEGRQLAVVGTALVLLLAGLGWRLWWALSPGLLYLLFLVPFGAFLTPFLQHFTADFIVVGLRLLDIPFEADTFQITIPEGKFFVAEACAGLRFLIASIAFGVLYAVTMFSSPWRRAAYIAVACVVPVVANGFRGLGIVLLGHVLGSAEAGAADHLIYGWVFFSCVIVMLALGGLPFREQPAPARAAAPAGARAQGGRVLLACLPVLAVAWAAPLLADRGRPPEAAAVTGQAAIVPPVGCNSGAVHSDGAAQIEEFQCGVQHLRVATATLAPRLDPARILDAARLPALRDLGGDIDSQAWNAAPRAPWMLLQAHDTGRVAAYTAEVDGAQAIGGLHDRLRMMRDMLAGSRSRPRTRTITMTPGGVDAAEVLKSFLPGADFADRTTP